MMRPKRWLTNQIAGGLAESSISMLRISLPWLGSKARREHTRHARRVADLMVVHELVGGFH